MVCEESQPETLFVAADRAKGIQTKEFNTKGAATLYFIRDVRDVTDGTDPPLGTVIQGTIADIANATDDNVGTFARFQDSTSQTDPIAEWDFGAAASRSIGVILFLPNLTGTSITWSYAIDPDGLGFGSFVNFATGPSVKTRFKLFDSQTVQKLRIKMIQGGSLSRDGRMLEIFDLEKEHGTNKLSLEFFDQARSDWKNHTTFSTLDPFFDGVNVVIIDTASNMPHKATGLLRVGVDNVGRCNYSLIVIKADPCKV